MDCLFADCTCVRLQSGNCNVQGHGQSVSSSKDRTAIMLEVLRSVLDKVEDINIKLSNDIVPQLERLEKQVTQLEQMKEKVDKISVKTEEQATGDERRSVAIDNLSSQLKRQAESIRNTSVQIQQQLKSQEEKSDKIQDAILNIVAQERNISKELQAHDERLKAHDLTCKGCKEGNQIKSNGNNCSSYSSPRDCADIGVMGETLCTGSGVYHVCPAGPTNHPNVPVFCDFVTPGGGWLVFQRRKDGSVDFERTWKEYAKGFGDPAGEFWLGNDILHQLTSRRSYKIRIDLEDFNGQKRFAEYSKFSVGSAGDRYKLTVSGYSGNAGDSFLYQNGMQFSTKDSDSSGGCTHRFRGAWWYVTSGCHQSNLNGLYLRGPHKSWADGIEWRAWYGYHYSLKTTEMKIAAVK